jgi:hypothetical protein
VSSKAMSVSWYFPTLTGVCGLLIGHPADTIKVRQQIFKSSGSVHIVVQTMKYEGVSIEEMIL